MIQLPRPRLRGIFRHVRITQNLQFLLGSYRYTPLPSPTSVRLLELKPSPDKKIVECSLKTFELQDAPTFQALSYTWGDPNTPLAKSAFSSKCRAGQLVAADPLSSHNDASSRDFEPVERVLSRRHSIVCDGRIIKVTSNLRDALRMLANSVSTQSFFSTPKYYWIDALCLNQSDILERNSQVAKMADIFQKAKSVIVWLGKEDEFTLDALTTIQRVAAIPEEEWSSVPYTSFYDPSIAKQCHFPRLTFHNWLGFIALINRPWFKRAWVVQEIALAKSARVFCGTKSFDWEMLSKTLWFIKRTKWYHHLHTDKMKHVATIKKNPGIYKRLLKSSLGVGVGPAYLDATRLKIASKNHADGETNEKPPLRVLIETHRFSKSTDSRDKIYAFLGLADRKMEPFRTQPMTLTPNYNKSVQQVYTEAACALLTTYKNLSLLSHVQDISSTRVRGLPSWVPDYSAQLDPYPLRFRGPGFWKAAGGPRWDINQSSMEDGELDVQGYQLDIIDQTSVLQNESADPSASWASIVKLALWLQLPYPNPAKKKDYNPSRMEVLWRTLTTDTYNKTYPAPSSTGELFIDYILNLQIRHRLTPWSSADEFQPHHSPLSDSIYPEWNTLLDLEPPTSPYSLARYKKRLGTVVESMFNGTYSPIGLAQLQHEFDQSGGRRRRLFSTRLDYLGTGPRSLQEGDEVWILHGGNVPFVLRPVAGGNEYRLVGEAFVYGVMHGEALALALPCREITIV
ncbi:hypothetical protein BS50DRAFT_600482 [Corynespora cassiicola Philippines]|uniref:Heterokaryon incompatibility domain-containing protein n=1 Tax=Corynespora cassiicola Philippines TaxID=1448308 RepID=A0A2T2NP69_CORCC|nr:hypothetical protein BS50DRAFT_600482 [Corynespora cassiicola Philippines]